jgi:hypothetical protein
MCRNEEIALNRLSRTRPRHVSGICLHANPLQSLSIHTLCGPTAAEDASSRSGRAPESTSPSTYREARAAREAQEAEERLGAGPY